MEKKIYVLKNGDNPGICLDWLSFFERIDCMSKVEYRIFTYKTELGDGDVDVPFSMKWAFQKAKEYLEEPEFDAWEIPEFESASDFDEGFEFEYEPEYEPESEEESESEVESVIVSVANRAEIKKKREEAQKRLEALKKEEALKRAEAARRERELDRELRKTLWIREDLNMGSALLDFLLQLVGEDKPYISGGFYTGRYYVGSLYTLLLCLVLDTRRILEAAYEKHESLTNTKGDALSKTRWVESVEYELFRSAEFTELKDKLEDNGLCKLDLNDLVYRNIERVKDTKLCKIPATYFNMMRFVQRDRHTIVDLYNELTGNGAYRDELVRISGAMINPELTRKKKVEETENRGSLEQLVNQTKAVRNALKEVIIGQDEVIDKFEQAFFHSEKAAITSKKSGPRSVFLFAGPPGVGKTYMAETFAKALKISYHRFDMASYGSHNAMEEIVGISSFYLNAKPGVLTSYVEENPRCVLLFDEIEKASPDVIKIFLQILDEGQCFDRFYDSNVSFKDCIIIMTTNAGKQLYENAGNENLTNLPDRVVIDGFEKDVNPNTKVPYFPPEIVSRMASHSIIVFNHLKAAAIRQVIKKDVEKNLAQNRDHYGFDISKGSDVVAATVQYAVGGGGEARNASKLAGKLIDKELYELFSLADEKLEKGKKSNLNQVSWECDFTEASEEIKQFYLGERDCVVPILKATDREYTISITKMLRVVVVNDVDLFLDTVRCSNVLFAVIEYAYGLSEAESSMSISDVKTIGSNAFDIMKKENPDLPVYLLKNDKNYLYSESEKRILHKKGAEGFIDEESLAKQLTKAYSDICCKKAMEILTVRHQVLTYSTRKEINPEGTGAKIIFYHLKLEMAVDSEDKDSLISDELRPNKKWKDVYVTSDVKKELEFFIKYLKNPGEYVKTGARVPRGALMVGPPGTGKTSLAKVVATESMVNFLSVSADELLNGGSKKVHDIFRVARKYAPAVLFIDEIDAIGISRNATGANSVLNALLTEMDGFRRMDGKPVFVMAATNLKGIDAALARRFDRTFVVDLPDEKGRRWLLKRLLDAHSDMFRISRKEQDSIVARSRGLSPADLENVIEAALREGIRNGKAVSDALLDEMFEKSNHGEKNELSSEKEVEHTAYHEAGHAMIELFYGRFPEYMSVVARSNFNGYVQQEKMTEHPTRERLLQQICTAMGGRAAELEFGYGLTPGASGDLLSATGLATRMVCEFGMYAEEIGLAVRTQEEYKTDEKAKALVNRILQEQLTQARKIIRENKEVVVRLVGAVLKNEQKYLTKKDIMNVYKGK